MRILNLPVATLLMATALGLGWNPNESANLSRNEHLVMSVLWVQRSAEWRALSYQAFNIARLQLERDLDTNRSTRRRAVVVDIDETILDNSPHMAKLIAENEVFPFAWTDWVGRAEAEPLPGSVEFLTYAVSRGYDIFYVSNRSEQKEFDGTLYNLKTKKFPQVEKSRLLLMAAESSKETRRRTIERTHDIVLLLGDNLNDMAALFEKQPVEKRFEVTDSYRMEFGHRFIVLPNPMYGEWEAAVYGYQRGFNDEQKNRKRKAALMAF
ncbi:MAG: 5'-nucleotidase, lipoprotein e(P4) family [Ignavibacteriales bacterium]|nr:5'-nucleotidase, lipoprotein e(P4) family [Ignavibacteriales bacterium]